MTDFLTRLVNATYGAAPTLRPRPVAPYEPMATPPPVWSSAREALPAAPEEVPDRTASIAGLASTPDVPIAQRTSAPSDDMASTLRQAQPTRHEEHLAPAPADQGREHTSRPAHGAAKGESPRQSSVPHSRGVRQPASNDVALPVSSVASLSPPQRQARRPILDQQPLIDVQDPPAPLHVAASPLRVSAAPATETSPPVGGNAPASLPLPSPTLAAMRATMLSPQHPGMVTGGAGEGELTGRRHPAPLSGREHGEQEQRASIGRVEGTPPPAPIVHVKIGRIVIQAAPATPTRAVAARASQPAAPALSLDRYLKERNGGEA